MKQTLLEVALPALVLVALMLPLRGGFTDDGFIHIQYAHNLKTRGEFSFNAGEVSHGTTSPLWVMTLAALSLPIEDKEALIGLSRVLSWLAALAALVAFHRLLFALGASRPVRVAATFAFAADAWLVRWSALGMESSSATWLSALIALASLRAYDDRRAAARFGALLAIGALVRPEMYLALPVYIMGALTLRPRPSARTVAAALLTAAVLLVPWLIFAKLEMGSFLPNTAGAKSGGWVAEPMAFVRKLSPVAKIVVSTQAIAVAAMLVDLVVARRGAVIAERAVRFMALWMPALPLAYVAFDIQILSRYLLLVTPAVCAVGWRAVEARVPGLSLGRARAALAAGAIAAVSVNVGFYATVVLPPSRAFSEDLTRRMADLARYLRDHSPPDAVVAAGDIGYLAFYSERRVLDLGGLVEPAMKEVRERYTYEEIVDRALYFDVPGYPHVDYLVDREHEPDRFQGRVLAGRRFERVYATVVRNLGIRKPGDFHYVLYKLTPVDA